MQDTKTKADINLIKFHKITNRHVLALEADISECDRRELLHMSNIIRVAGNELVAVMKKQYEQLLRTKRYRRLRDMYAKAKKTEDKKKISAITAEMTEMQKSYHVTWEFCRKSMIEVNYPPLARAEVGASGQRSLVTTPAKPGSYQRPSFFLPTKNVELRSKSGNEPCCKAGKLSMYHRQAPVFHRLGSIYR